jgi:hypothetical protein
MALAITNSTPVPTFPYTTRISPHISTTIIEPVLKCSQHVTFTFPPNDFDIIIGFRIDAAIVENIDHIELEMGNICISRVRPEINGKIIFWKNFQLRPCDFKFHILNLRCHLANHLNSDIYLDVRHSCPWYSLPIEFIYARTTYNFLRVCNGMGSLAYTN